MSHGAAAVAGGGEVGTEGRQKLGINDSSIMVQQMFGLVRYSNRKIHRFFFVITLLIVSSCSVGADFPRNSVLGGIRPLDPEEKEPCAVRLGAHAQMSAPCQPTPKRFRNGLLVTSQENNLVGSNIPVEWRARDHTRSSVVVDVRGRYGRQTRGADQVVGARQVKQEEVEEQLTRVGTYVGKSRRIKAGERSWLKAGQDCTKIIRGQKCVSCQDSPAAGGAAFSMLRAATAADAPANNISEAQVLLAWRSGLNGGPKNVFANWNLASEPNFCLWRGVECRNISQQQHVVSIKLPGNRIAGLIPSGLTALPFLTTLDLSYNHLSGQIPVDLADISSLQTLNLSFNQLNSNIPPFGNTSSSLQSLNLWKNKLTGDIPASLGQCKQLTELNLAHNKLGGDIPSELGTLQNLQELILSQNNLVGSLPPSLGSCTGLVNVSLGWNQLIGGIPDEYSNLRSLQGFYLHGNNFTETLPIWLSDLTSLAYLHLYENEFEGEIPSLLGNSQALRSLNLSNNNLVGSIPAALVESTNLFEIDFSVNQLNGSIPGEFGYLTQLQRLRLGQNLLTGSIPTSLGQCVQLTEIVLSSNQFTGPILSLNTFLQLQILSLNDNKLNGNIPGSVTKCVNLTVLDLSNNGLSGVIPSDIGQLEKLTNLELSGNSLRSILPQLGGLISLQSLNVEHNLLEGSIPPDIGQLTNLTSLGLSGNSLGGNLPELGSLINLQSLTLEYNLLAGSIPPTLGNLVQLEVLSLGSNLFVGNIPSELSQCISLTTLTLDNNGLNGSIPNSLGQLRSLRVLHLQGNRLSGQMPTILSNFTLLQDLVMSDNELNGEIPASLLSILSQLQDNFSIANNRISGPLPPQLGLLTMVQTMNLSGNNFSDGIPDEIGNCTALVRLDLAKNYLTGMIPSSIGRLSNLQLLNVSHNELTGSIPAAAVGALTNLMQLDLTANNLSGQIPSSLSNLSKLLFLNVSDNVLQGPVPQDGAFQKFSALSFLGNPDLCGTILKISCGSPAKNNSHKHSLSTAAWIGIAAGAVGVVALVVAAGFLWWRLVPWGRTPQKRGSIIARSELFYPQLRFTVQDLKLATENFSDINILGAGSLSNVFRGVLPELVLVAVKKLKVPNGTEIPPGFIEELDELGRLRHRHLVAILGYCFDTEMNALVVQFMSNGSLEEHLHRGQTCDLDWPTRAKVGIGVAKALTYLHHDCGSTIVHCDLKPSNVLLDADFEAHLEDFGLSRLIFAHKLMDMTNSSVGSSIGYFPPEYGYSPTVSPKGDVYSYGILLLELLTGKKPTMDMFKDDMSLAKWCQSSFPNKILDVLDPTLIGSKDHKQVNLFMKVALMCAKETPEDRPTMKSVLDMLR